MERVGRQLYGQYWIGEMKDREWEIGRKHFINGWADLPATGKAVAMTAIACFRYHGSAAQYRQVGHWLRDCGIDHSPERFDAQEFERWFKKTFPSAKPKPTNARLTAVRKLLGEGHEPGRGGTVGWKEFCDLVRKPRTGIVS
jgi:hypothetical protein